MISEKFPALTLFPVLWTRATLAPFCHAEAVDVNLVTGRRHKKLNVFLNCLDKQQLLMLLERAEV
jgi:hypothetical protein